MLNKKVIIYMLTSMLIIGIIISLLYKCESANTNYSGKSIIPIYAIDQYSDSSFVDNNVNSIVEYKNKYYICEGVNKRIVVLDSGYKWIRQIGQPGKGPGEFIAPLTCEVKNDSIYVLDSEKNEIMVFTLTGNYKRSNKYIDRVSDRHRFVVKQDGNIVLSLCNPNNPIHELSNGKIVNSFGQYEKTKDNRAILLNGQRHIGIIGDRIIAVCEAEPYVELYDMKGKYIKRIDLSKLKQVKNYMLYNEERRGKAKGIQIFPLFKDVSIYKNFIYVLFNNYSKQDKSVNVFVLEYKNDELFIREILDIKNSEGKYISTGWSICKTSNKLIISESGMKISQILIYNK